MAVRQSAGILLFRRSRLSGADEVEVLLAHPGGPFFTNKDEGCWSIPKGEPDAGEDDLLTVARREFAEEVGSEPPDSGPDGSAPVELGTIVQKGGKVVHAWAVEGDLDPAASVSNTFELEWPPRSGPRRTFPEIDRVALVRAGRRPPPPEGGSDPVRRPAGGAARGRHLLRRSRNHVRQT